MTLAAAALPPTLGMQEQAGNPSTRHEQLLSSRNLCLDKVSSLLILIRCIAFSASTLVCARSCAYRPFSARMAQLERPHLPLRPRIHLATELVCISHLPFHRHAHTFPLVPSAVFPFPKKRALRSSMLPSAFLLLDIQPNASYLSDRSANSIFAARSKPASARIRRVSHRVKRKRMHAINRGQTTP
jgi:hypothetical protein